MSRFRRIRNFWTSLQAGREGPVRGSLPPTSWICTEGFDRPNALEERFALSALIPERIAARATSVGGVLGLLGRDFRAAGEGFTSWIARRLRWTGTRFEAS